MEQLIISVTPWLLAAVLTTFSAAAVSIRRVSEGNQAIVERLGRYHRKLMPGLNFGVLPFIDKVVVEAPTHEEFLEFEVNDVITNDGIRLKVDVVLFLRFIDLFSAFYEIRNAKEAITKLAISALRSCIKGIDWQEIYSATDYINKTAFEILDAQIEPWGVKVTGITIQNTTLVEESRDTVAIPFPNGIDWQAFENSFSKIIVENEGVELSVESIFKREDGVLIIKVKVPPNVDKEKILIDFIRNYESSALAIEQKYQKELQGKDEQISIHRNHYSTLEGIIHKLADRPARLEPATIEVKAIAGGQFMNDQSQNINIGRDMNLSGSTLNLGEISGSVTNTINQLQTTENPETIQLANLLKQLQAAIETEPQLNEDDKALALEQTGKLAEAAKTPGDEAAKKPAKLAVGFLKGLVSTLPDTAKLAEACSKLLPLITSLIGL